MRCAMESIRLSWTVETKRFRSPPSELSAFAVNSGGKMGAGSIGLGSFFDIPFC